MAPYALHSALLTLLLTSATWSGSASAAVTWKGDFETGNTEQWGYLLNGSGIQVVTDPKLEGAYAAKIEITNQPEHIWSNDLNRVEFQYSPPSTHTDEGKDTYFGFSFLFPELLTEDGHQIAYYESASTYQQVMAFEVRGSSLSFVTRKPSDEEHYSAEDAIFPMTWHDLAIHVHWSKMSDQGSVDVWLDGNQIVSGASAQTLADDNDHFVQLGILRDTISKTETMFVDNARAGDSIEEVLAFAPASTDPTDPAGMGGQGAGGTGTGGTAAPAAGGSAPAPTGGGTASGGVQAMGPSPTSSGCSTRGAAEGFGALWLLPLALMWIRKRTRV